MEVKQQSTGNNDSVEDAVIAIMNIKTTAGKLINFNAQVKAVYEALAARELYAPPPKQTERDYMSKELTKEEILKTIFDAVYAQYPKKEWQGLSDDEINEALMNYEGWGRIDFARAIEQALKEKNNVI